MKSENPNPNSPLTPARHPNHQPKLTTQSELILTETPTHMYGDLKMKPALQILASTYLLR